MIVSATSNVSLTNASNYISNENPLRDSTVSFVGSDAVRLTTLCILRICFGYRVPVPPTTEISTGTTMPPDIVSSSIAISVAVLSLVSIGTLTYTLLKQPRRQNSLHAVWTPLRQLIVRSQANNHVQQNNFIEMWPTTAATLYDRLCQVSPLQLSTSFTQACVICLDDLRVSEIVRQLPCHHTFHAECIDRWLLHTFPSLSSHESEHYEVVLPRPACPICKMRIFGFVHPRSPKERIATAAHISTP